MPWSGGWDAEELAVRGTVRFLPRITVMFSNSVDDDTTMATSRTTELDTEQ